MSELKPRVICDLCRKGDGDNLCYAGGVDKCLKDGKYTKFELRRVQPAACEIAEYAEDCKDCGFCAQPANEPLTLEQLREMEQRGEGIYVTHADGSPIFRGKQYTAAVLDRIAAFGAMGYHLQAIYGRGLTLAEDDCGKTWLAYRRPPEMFIGVDLASGHDFTAYGRPPERSENDA